MKLRNAIRIRAALAAARNDHNQTLEAAAEIKAARRKANIARLRARGRRLYAAWLKPSNPGWHRDQLATKPANVLSIEDTRPDDIQFPRIAEAIGDIRIVRAEGGAA